MELDQLKKIWEANDQEIDSRLQLNKELLKEASVNKVQSYLFEFRLENYIELLINGAASFYLIRMFFNNLEDLKIALLIAFLAIMLFMEFVWNLYKLIQADKLSYKRPLIQNLKTLERLRWYNRWEITSLIVLIPLFSATFIILIPRLFFDLDVFPILGNGIWYFVLGSAIVGFLIVGILRLFPDKKMEQAIAFLREISQYESEK